MKEPKHKVAILQALLVTGIWSSSWVLIKFGLQGMPPLTFAGLRYFLGFIILLFIFRKKDFEKLINLNTRQWLELLSLGLVMYFFTQGAQFISLKYFPSMVTALILNLTPIMVGIFGVFLLKEKPTWAQVLGICICLIGTAFYFVPKLEGEMLKSIFIIVPVLGMIANALSSLLGRAINRREHLEPKIITVVSMGIGSLLLLGTGVVLETFPQFDLKQIGIVVWLAAVHTAFAFTLWNHTLRTLTSVESSVINNTMMIQIAILTWVFLDETLSSLEITGLLIAAAGALIVQLRKRK